MLYYFLTDLDSGDKKTHGRRKSPFAEERAEGNRRIGATAAGGALTTGTAAALGSGAVYQYYHTDWTTIEDNLATLANQGYDAIQVPPAQFSRVYKYERERSTTRRLTTSR